jgi:hypothetical protein
MLAEYEDEIAQLAERVRAARATYRRHLPPKLKERLGALARAAAAAGMPPKAFSRAVGVTPTTLAKYMAAFGEPSAAQLVPVEMRSSSPDDGALVRVAPSGWRLEKLDLRTAVALLRELG